MRNFGLFYFQNGKHPEPGFPPEPIPWPIREAPTHASRPVLDHGQGDGFPGGFRLAERPAADLRVHTLSTASASGLTLPGT